ncbi:hypothetical protein PV10_07367 [Exophiala mesophila]|uniref:Uncharacterized protein n=1 Tax=Exophiala mesophila TaxID=212818 RepID=A0A0D1Z5F6_EXOME|nr:uncharacterized protein PV10_07367 [Exophiala mesophila]KIV90017.1 hypothetical protein PV10_07367 [Exophiala mesophila]
MPINEGQVLHIKNITIGKPHLFTWRSTSKNPKRLMLDAWDLPPVQTLIGADPRDEFHWNGNLESHMYPNDSNTYYTLVLYDYYDDTKLCESQLFRLIRPIIDDSSESKSSGTTTMLGDPITASSSSSLSSSITTGTRSTLSLHHSPIPTATVLSISTPSKAAYSSPTNNPDPTTISSNNSSDFNSAATSLSEPGQPLEPRDTVHLSPTRRLVIAISVAFGSLLIAILVAAGYKIRQQYKAGVFQRRD